MTFTKSELESMLMAVNAANDRKHRFEAARKVMYVDERGRIFGIADESGFHVCHMYTEKEIEEADKSS